MLLPPPEKVKTLLPTTLAADAAGPPSCGHCPLVCSPLCHPESCWANSLLEDRLTWLLAVRSARGPYSARLPAQKQDQARQQKRATDPQKPLPSPSQGDDRGAQKADHKYQRKSAGASFTALLVRVLPRDGSENSQKCPLMNANGDSDVQQD